MEAAPIETGRAAAAAFLGDADPKYVLRFAAQKAEVDLAKQFLAKGGTLGGAAARGTTSLALSHADAHQTFLLTDTSQTIDLPVPAKLLENTAFKKVSYQAVVWFAVGFAVCIKTTAADKR